MARRALTQTTLDGYGTRPQLPAARLTSQTALILEHDGTATDTTWGRFCAANADGLDQAERMLIAASLSAGETFHGGGGAQAEWTIRRAA